MVDDLDKPVPVKENISDIDADFECEFDAPKYTPTYENLEVE